ncbi:metallophosphoesterase [Nocardioides sp. SYSU D00065]|uniref:metallophosphoesterase n=1 Tax=Nocardioides sp. SYSU D00065 TaxID=2817378 RepID=UPI001B33663C|nr:DUF2341 domain-containing protein [Nocardioides sp. SYSU D00065]
MSSRPMQSRRLRQLVLPVITLAVGVLTVIPATAGSASAATVPGLEGSGSTGDPLLIDSAADLDAATAAINSEPATFASLSYRLSGDVDYEGGTYPGIAAFSGTFDGAGHTISNLAYANTADSVGFFRSLTGATVTGLTLASVQASTATGDGTGGLVATVAADSRVVGNTVLDSSVRLGSGGAVNTQSGGLVGGSTGTTTVTDNVLWNVSVTGHKYAAGLVAYPRAGTTIARNLLVDVTVRSDAGGAGATAGLILSQGVGAASTGGNVVIRGAVSKSGSGTAAVGPEGMTVTRPNLVSTATTITAGSVPGAVATRGTLAPATETDLPDLTAQPTYEGLGWDFAEGTGAWRWEPAVSHPAPRLAALPPLKQAGVPGAGTSADPFLISSVRSFEAMAAAVNADPATYGSGSYRLTADLDFDARTFPGLDTFAGDLDGAGHTLTDIGYGPGSGAGATDLGLVRDLTGRVRNLAVEGISLHPTATTEHVAGVAVRALPGSSVSLVRVESDLDAPDADVAGGLVAVADDATLHANVVDVTVRAAGAAGGIAGRASGGTEVAESLVDAEVSALTAGGVVATVSGDGTVVRRNVVHGGSTTGTSAGRVLGSTSGTGDWTVADNLAERTVTVSGSTVTGPGERNQHGTDVTAEQLRVRSTYRDLEWNFVDTWRWDTAALVPAIKYVTAAEQPNRITTTFHGDPTTRRAFTWYQDLDAEDPGVLLSTDPTFPDSATTLVPATEEESEHGETVFRAVASGLTPGVTYHYRVGDDLTGLWSDLGHFRTPTGEGDFSFIDLTDTQARGAGEAAVSAATMAKALRTVPDAEFMVHNGDVVQTGEEESEWQDLLGAAQESLLATTIAPVAGNHDLARNSFSDHFTLERPNGQDPSTGAYYSYDYNGAHFVMLNTNEGNDRTPLSVGDVDYEPISDAQLGWARRDVAAARERGSDWIVLTLHKGPYSAADHPTEPDAVSLRERLVPLIDELDIDLVLQGHDHFWSRTQVLQSDPAGVAGAKVVPTEVITEVRGGVHVDYKVDPDGTVFVLPGTAGTKHYPQLTDPAGAFDLESYFGLFERLGGGLRWGNAGESFVEVQVTDERLTVNRYEIVGRGEPTFAEGFGIDRQVSSVDATLGELPDAASVTLDDEPAIVAARRLVRALTKAQRAHLSNLDRLRAAEEALRVLRRTVAVDGSEVAWADPAATSRQPITVRNDQRRALEDVPVRLAITDTPDVDAATLAITTSRSVPLSFEVETWQPGGTSVVWVKLPELAKVSQQIVWAYFGGTGAADNDPADVWSDEFELVEHFAADTEAGGTRPDSSGTTTGTLVGEPLAGEVADGRGLPGGMVSRFSGSRLQYGGNLGRFTREFTVSGIYSLTQADLDAVGGVETALLGKRAPGAETPTLTLGPVKATGQARTRTPFGGAISDVPVDGEPHLVTMTFDGMTFAVFVDGEIVHEQMAEGRQFPDQPGVLTAIGDTGVDPERPDTLVEPFHGVADEVWVASTEFIPEYDAFRTDNYFGDAVVLGDREQRTDAGLSLALGNPSDGTAVEAGTVDVFGSVTRRSRLVATIDGEEVFSQQVDAGTFTVPVPVLSAGDDVRVAFTATAVTDPSRSAAAALTLDVTDTTGPAEPRVSDVRPAGQPLTLSVQPRTDVAEKVEARFYANSSVALGSDNVTVRTGSTTDRVPSSLTPASGVASDALTPTTVGDDRNPYQIYRVRLTPEQTAEPEQHFSWRGTGGDRTVSAWVWDTTTSAWVLKDSAADRDGGQLNLDVRTTSADHAVDGDGVLTVLVWRGLTELPWGEDRDYDNTVPSPDDYDWSFNHVGDTQLYTEATPWTMTEQFEYIRDRAEERKTALVLQAGDWVNREEYEDEWQWRNAEPSARILEDADIPYMISWGNHDYNETRNGRQMLQKYFPAERFAASLEGSPWSMGGTHDIDNYYYTGEIDGAKLLWLEVGFWSAESDDDPAFAWAQDVIESHPDHTVILATHNYLVASGGGGYSNPRINTLLVDPYPNVKLVLTGHNSGTFVSSRTNSGGTRVYGILTDYQTRAWGGHGFLKNLSVDAENGLIYVNTYSPWLQTTTSDGRWNNPIEESSTPGFHGDNAENYVLELDLGGTQTRTLAADRVTFSSGVPEQVGEPVDLTGEDVGSVDFSPDLGVTHEWYAVLTDRSGNSVTSATRTVRRMQAHPIGYDLAGGTLPPGAANPVTHTADDEPLTLVNPTRAGYEFAGWTGTGLAGPTVDVTIPTGSAEARSYVATWRRVDYPLSYDLAGGVLPSLNPSSYHVESGPTRLVDPIRGGHEFVGWLGTDLDRPTTALTIPAGSTGARSYVAVWSPLAPAAEDSTVQIEPVPAGTYGQGTPVAVRVTGVGGGAASGEVVLSGVGQPVVAQLAGGRAVLVVPPSTGAGSHVVSVTYTGSATLRPSVSSARLVRAKASGPRLGLSRVRARGRTGRAVVSVAYADGVPAPSGVLRLVATRTSDGATRTRALTLREGRTRAKLPARMGRGRWKVTVTWAGSADLEASRSRTMTVRVRR